MLRSLVPSTARLKVPSASTVSSQPPPDIVSWFQVGGGVLDIALEAGQEGSDQPAAILGESASRSGHIRAPHLMIEA
jgi:hypothetical protein